MNNAEQNQIAQTLYVEWLKEVKGLGTVTKEERIKCFNETAQYSLEAAQEFMKSVELKR